MLASGLQKPLVCARLCDPIRSIKHMLYAYAACCMERMQPRGSSSSCSPEASTCGACGAYAHELGCAYGGAQRKGLRWAYAIRSLVRYSIRSLCGHRGTEQTRWRILFLCLYGALAAARGAAGRTMEEMQERSC
jgi:hypothetical protein